jgi:hypothetical protein
MFPLFEDFFLFLYLFYLDWVFGWVGFSSGQLWQG